MLVLATLDLGNAILLLVGPLVPRPRRAAAARPSGARWSPTGTQYFQCWWMGTFPGLAIFTAVLAFNFLGDSLRDVFDPQTSRRLEETRG